MHIVSGYTLKDVIRAVATMDNRIGYTISDKPFTWLTDTARPDHAAVAYRIEALKIPDYSFAGIEFKTRYIATKIK